MGTQRQHLYSAAWPISDSAQCGEGRLARVMGFNRKRGVTGEKGAGWRGWRGGGDRGERCTKGAAPAAGCR